jgi:hypothetical protein
MISSKTTTKSISQQNSLSSDITLAKESENNNFVSTEDGSFVEKKVCQPCNNIMIFVDILFTFFLRTIKLSCLLWNNKKRDLILNPTTQRKNFIFSAFHKSSLSCQVCFIEMYPEEPIPVYLRPEKRPRL